ncbi:Thioredoxin family protein [Trichomonas vaginalis G3]|uniref:protein disulfide-isomerase n=1 Tax=Trichomonas vaginalis (strain ATCC PRA-98 / G3) TaxID=412133 RepID=A2DP23_TRIV3|nr:intramolecular oxidoreductase activity, transposing S-S bonds [Trichomonas vaginalis G3]EAY17872.1 Thioredoxin family protein [Trichomonas vaginalis G3]KAI5489910.1 intramolecular oxidoreductase activity, transposing S-S bonds [Trichomonas vaginalis G3]|eukprot:XP_001330007.1 Thioredoxin family protein [Trichomonas vaginalis G3]
MKEKPIGVTIFHDTVANNIWANFGLEKYKNNISFARSGHEDGAKYGCLYYPCCVAFQNGKKMDIPPPLARSSSFFLWLGELLEGPIKHLKSKEQLRVALEEHGQTVFGIDLEEPPRHLGKLQYYSVNSSLFAKFNISLQKGYYIYDNIERRIEKFEGKPLKTLLTDPRAVDISSKPFYGGFVVNTKLDKVSEMQIDLLKKLAEKYGDKFQFGPIVGTNALLFLKAGRIEGLDAPYFVAFKTSNLTEGRWLLYRETDNIMDLPTLEKFVQDIMAGKLPYTIISEPIPEDANNNLKHIVGSTFSDVVFEDGYDTLVAFTSSWCKLCPRLLIVLRELAELTKDTKARICFMDGSENDTPMSVPEFSSYPTLMLFPSGHKADKPLVYKGTYRVKDLSEFIANRGTTGFKLTQDVDFDALEEKITDEFHKNKQL